MNDEETERDKYTRMWDKASYRERSPGLRVLPVALNLLRPAKGASFYDFGCGHGHVSAALAGAGFDVCAVDLAANSNQVFKGEFVVANLWDLPATLLPRDHAICVDVLEHLPEKHVVAALRGMGQRIKVRGYFQAALFHDHCGDEIGETLHMTVKPAYWWGEQFSKVWPRFVSKATEKHFSAIVPGLAVDTRH